MTRQPPDHPLDLRDLSANHPPASRPSIGSVAQEVLSSDNDCQASNTASGSGERSQLNDFVAPPRLTHLDFLIIENSGFPNLAEFEIFLQLYLKPYQMMEEAERKKLSEQLEALQQCMPNERSVQVMMEEAHQSIRTGHPYSSLKHYANSSSNGYVLTSMISRCLNLTSFYLERVVFEAASKANKNTVTSTDPAISKKDCADTLSRGFQQWTAEDILKLKTFIYPNISPFTSHQPLPDCSDPHSNHVMGLGEEYLPSDLRYPWSYKQCIDYLCRRTNNFMNAPDPEPFFFSLPSNAKLQGMTTDQRAECVRKHIIEQDAKRAASRPGSFRDFVREAASERVTKGTQTLPNSELPSAASTNADRNPFILDSHKWDYQRHASHSVDSDGSTDGRQPAWSTCADSGNGNSTCGDVLSSGGHPSQAEDWIQPCKRTESVTFAGPLPKDNSKSSNGQRNPNAHSNTSLRFESRSESNCPLDEVPGMLSKGMQARAISWVEAPPLSNEDGDDDFANSVRPASVLKNGASYYTRATRGQLLAERDAQRRTGNEVMHDHLPRYQLQLSSQPGFDNDDKLHPLQKAIARLEGARTREDPFPSWKGVPEHQGGRPVSHASQEYQQQKMLLEWYVAHRKERPELEREEAKEAAYFSAIFPEQVVPEGSQELNNYQVPDDIAFINDPGVPVTVWQRLFPSDSYTHDAGPPQIALKEANDRRAGTAKVAASMAASTKVPVKSAPANSVRVESAPLDRAAMKPTPTKIANASSAQVELVPMKQGLQGVEQLNFQQSQEFLRQLRVQQEQQQQQRQEAQQHPGHSVASMLQRTNRQSEEEALAARMKEVDEREEALAARMKEVDEREKAVATKETATDTEARAIVPWRSGHWKCGAKGCGSHNFGKDRYCLRCGASHDDAEFVIGSRSSKDADNTDNTANTANTANSATDTDPAPVVPWKLGDWKLGDWKCGAQRCGYQNPSSAKVSCLRCGASRAGASFVYGSAYHPMDAANGSSMGTNSMADTPSTSRQSSDIEPVGTSNDRGAGVDFLYDLAIRQYQTARLYSLEEMLKFPDPKERSWEEDEYW